MVEKELDSVMQSLEKLIRLTEEKYAYIYEYLPSSEREVNLGIREVEILLDYLVFNSSSISGQEQSVTVNSLLKVLNEFEEVTDSFLNQELTSVLLRTFLNNSGDDRQNFSELIRVSQEVEDTLAVLRDLALNSIIFSIRAGHNGAAFQVLSDRINQISLGLGSRFNAMKSTVNRLIAWNDSFQRQLVEFIDYEEELKERYTNKFQREFQQITAALKAICHILKDNLGNTKKAFNGVSEIMVMIQNQDIIRQNIENLVKCLRIVQEKHIFLQGDSRERSLDYVVFANRVLETAKILMDNIEASIKESVLGLGQHLGRLHNKATDLEEDTKYLDQLFAGGGRKKSVLAEVFASVLDQIAELQGIKNQVDAKSNLLLGDRETFLELMGKVETDFEVINKEINILKKMKVLIKIELSRIDLENDFTLTGIVNAVDQVIDTINDNRQLFLKLRSYFLINIDRLNSGVNQTKNKLVIATDTLAGSKTRLETACRLSCGAVLASGKEMQEIFAQLKEPYRHLADTDSITVLLDKAKSRIEAIHKEMQQLQQQVFNRYGVSYWEEKEADLVLLAKQFTSYVERKALTTVAGSVLEDIGSSGGDIVLF